MGGGIIVEKTPELLERLKNLKADTKAPPDFDRLVEYFPNAYGSAEDEEPSANTKQKVAEKAKA